MLRAWLDVAGNTCTRDEHHISRQTVIVIETGRYAPSLELATRLARVSGREADDVFFWRDDLP